MSILQSGVTLPLRVPFLKRPRIDWLIFPSIDGGLMAKKAKKTTAKKAKKKKK
jgi:hypothetical protein